MVCNKLDEALNKNFIFVNFDDFLRAKVVNDMSLIIITPLHLLLRGIIGPLDRGFALPKVVLKMVKVDLSIFLFE